jgi:hypothetical protein
MYFLSVSAKVKKEFYWIFLIFLIVLPLLISAINIFVLDYFGKTIGRTLGFSGINSALLGSVSFFVGAFVKRLVPRIKILDIIFTMLFFVFAVEIMIYQASLWMLILVLAVLLYYLYRIFREVDLNKIIKSFRLKDKDVNAAFLIFITIILYAAVIFSLFPTDIQISENVNVDVLTHYIGLTLGFFMALLFGIRFENKFKSET